MMTCEQAKLQIQALRDNEIEEHQIAPLISHLESCYTCRNEYITFLKLQRKLAGIKIGIAGIAVGFLVLLGITIADRVRESKNDRYKGVMK